jgi:hypothetical protein
MALAGDGPDRLSGRRRPGGPAARALLDCRQDGHGAPEQRPVKTVHAHSGAAELGPYRHYMQKEIFEQPRAIGDTLEGVVNIAPSCLTVPTAPQRGACSRRSTRC